MNQVIHTLQNKNHPCLFFRTVLLLSVGAAVLITTTSHWEGSLFGSQFVRVAFLRYSVLPQSQTCRSESCLLLLSKECLPSLAVPFSPQLMFPPPGHPLLHLTSVCPQGWRQLEQAGWNFSVATVAFQLSPKEMDMNQGSQQQQSHGWQEVKKGNAGRLIIMSFITR